MALGLLFNRGRFPPESVASFERNPQIRPTVNRELETLLMRARIAPTQRGRKPPRSARIGFLGRTGAARRYCCRFYSGGHKFDWQMQEEACDWLDGWLGR